MSRTIEAPPGSAETWSVVEPTTRTVRVALAGCGAVGSAFVREVQARRESLAERHGVEIHVTSVLVRDVTRERDVRLPAGTVGADLDAFLATDAEVVVEAIGGIEPARRIVESALRRGCTVVTANKALLAAHGTSLVALAARHGAVLRYDAAVGGGVPVLRLIDDALGAGIPTSIRGILNGTTNFVQTGLEAGLTLDDVLAAARARGFAEADASRDLDGRDAADKIALVAWAAYGVAPETVQVRRPAEAPDPARLADLARRLGCTVRQLSECAVVEGGVVASVEPVLVPLQSAFARTLDEQNHVEVHTGWSAPLCASGPGAGGLPTATALLSDLLCTAHSARRAPCRLSAATDGRRFSWAVEAACAPIALHRVASARGPVRTNADADRCWMIVDGVSAGEIDAVLEPLRAIGALPIAVRLDEGALTGCAA